MCSGVAIEDISHFLEWKKGCWAFTRDVGDNYQGSVADGGECVHVCSWVVKVAVFRC